MPLTDWESFYVIVGSSAGALTGLQFVVIALIAESERRASSREIAAFGSPTVLHFCAALFVSATLSAPWRSVRGAGITLIACGLAGAIYSIRVRFRPLPVDGVTLPAAQAAARLLKAGGQRGHACLK